MTQSMIQAELEQHQQVVELTIAESGGLVLRIAEAVWECFHAGHKLLVCGNGGSAADAQHLAAEFVNRYRHDRGGLPALALTTDTSVLTSIANDASFSEVFSRQVHALASAGDVLIGISTSGRSANVLAALKTARALGVTTVGLTGEGGRETMAPLCDECVVVPSADTARIQECHAFLLHVLCGLVETRLLDAQPRSGGGAR